jgi:hypothetical protein
MQALLMLRTVRRPISHLRNLGEIWLTIDMHTKPCDLGDTSKLATAFELQLRNYLCDAHPGRLLPLWDPEIKANFPNEQVIAVGDGLSLALYSLHPWDVTAAVCVVSKNK